MPLFELDSVAPDFFDQCDGRGERGDRCQEQADHSGPCSCDPVPIGPVIECPFSAGHDDGTYGGGEWD